MSNPLNALYQQRQQPTQQSQGVAGIDQGAIDSFRQAIGMFKGSGNQGQIFDMMTSKNPNLKVVMQMCNGRDPKAMFYSECRRRGIDPDALVAQLGL